MFATPLLCMILESYSKFRAKAITAPISCPPAREFTKLCMTASINHLVTQYLGEPVEGVLHSAQHAAGPLLLRDEQIPVKAEQSRELGHTGVSTGRI